MQFIYTAGKHINSQWVEESKGNSLTGWFTGVHFNPLCFFHAQLFIPDPTEVDNKASSCSLNYRLYKKLVLSPEACNFSVLVEFRRYQPSVLVTILEEHILHPDTYHFTQQTIPSVINQTLSYIDLLITSIYQLIFEKPCSHSLTCSSSLWIFGIIADSWLILKTQIVGYLKKLVSTKFFPDKDQNGFPTCCELQIYALHCVFSTPTSAILKGILSKSVTFFTALGPEFTVICRFLPLRLHYGRS